MIMKLFRSDDKMSPMLTQLESQPEFGSGSESGGVGDDEPGDDEDGGEDEEDDEDADSLSLCRPRMSLGKESPSSFPLQPIPGDMSPGIRIPSDKSPGNAWICPWGFCAAELTVCCSGCIYISTVASSTVILSSKCLQFEHSAFLEVPEEEIGVDEDPGE
ncbi:hypothetical protein Tco_0243470 [Tanacetum coccineum]